MRSVLFLILLIAVVSPVTWAQSPRELAACPTIAQQDLGAELLTQVGRLPRARLMTGIGQSKLKISTKSGRAQHYFNQGLNQLHVNWNFEAYRSFREVVRRDPQAAMGYWGMAFVLRDEVDLALRKQRLKLIAQALKLSPSVSEQEQFYIHALSLRDKEGDAAYLRTMEALVAKFPGDVEAQLFLIPDLIDGYDRDGNPRPGTQRARRMLEALEQKVPGHFAVRYQYIRLLAAGPDFKLARKAAEKITAMAPNLPQVVNLPGQIAFQFGDYDAAYAAFLQTLKVDADYMQSERISAEDNANYINNLDYLIAAAAESGRLREGRRFAELLRDILPQEGRETSAASWMMFYQGRTAEARLYWRFGKWRHAARSLEKLLEKNKLPGKNIESYYRGLLAYMNGRNALREKNFTAALEFVDETELRRWELYRAAPAKHERAFKKLAAQVLAIALDELRGEIYSRKGEHELAIGWLRQAQEKEQALLNCGPPAYPRPVRQSLGQAFLREGNWRQARSIWKGILMTRPNNGHAFFGVAKVYETINSKRKVREYFKKFLAAWRFADADLRSVKEAKAWLEKNGSRNSIFQIFSW